MEASPLSKLPPELRNMLYDLVFEPDGIEEKSSQSIKPQTPSRILDINHSVDNYFDDFTPVRLLAPLHGNSILAPEPGITRACKQLRAESLKLYYTRHFTLRISDLDGSIKTNWQRRIRQLSYMFWTKDIKMLQSIKSLVIVWNGIEPLTRMFRQYKQIEKPRIKLKDQVDHKRHKIASRLVWRVERPSGKKPIAKLNDFQKIIRRNFEHSIEAELVRVRKVLSNAPEVVGQTLLD